MLGLYAECFVSLAGDKRTASVASKGPVSLGFAWFYLSPINKGSFEYDAFRFFGGHKSIALTPLDFFG